MPVTFVQNASIGLFVAFALFLCHKSKRHQARACGCPNLAGFLDDAQSLDTKAFNPWLQKNIFDYKRADVSAQDTLDADFARAMIQAVQNSVGLSQADLQKQRNAVEYAQRQQGS